MKRNHFRFILSIVLMLGLLMTPAHLTSSDAASDTEYVRVDGLNWGIDRSKGQITWFPREWDGTSFPTELDGMKVQSIGEYSCQYHDNIKELVIPDGYTSVPAGAFRGCHRLEKLTIPESVKKIGDDFDIIRLKLVQAA